MPSLCSHFTSLYSTVPIPYTSNQPSCRNDTPRSPSHTNNMKIPDPRSQSLDLNSSPSIPLPHAPKQTQFTLPISFPSLHAIPLLPPSSPSCIFNSLDPTIETSLLNYLSPINYRNKAQTSISHLTFAPSVQNPHLQLRIATTSPEIWPLLHKCINSIS